MTEIPETTAGAVYGHGWRQLRRHFGILLGVTVVLVLLGSAFGTSRESGPGSGNLLRFGYQVFVYGPLCYGGYFVFLEAARNNRPTFADLFRGFQGYWNVVLANLVVWFIIGFGFLLLIIPGIIFACKLAFTPYLVMERNMRALEAIKESWRLTRGHAWTVFLIGLLAIPIVLAGLLAFGVGVIVSIMWISLALASLYLGVQSLGTENYVSAESRW